MSTPEYLLLEGGRVFDPYTGRDGLFDVMIDVKTGRIDSVFDPKSVDVALGDDIEVVPCHGLTILPGLIDMHVHLREPGFEYKETIKTGGEAAVNGGFTTVACMPNTKPSISDPIIVERIKAEAVDSPAHIEIFGTITQGRHGEKPSGWRALAEAGVCGFSDDGDTCMDSEIMRKMLEFSHDTELIVSTHSEDAALTARAGVNYGAGSWKLKCKGYPKCAEEIIIYRDLRLAEMTEGRLHVGHVSTAGGINLIREAKKMGLPVTCEVTMHHLLLTEHDVWEKRSNAKMSPPLRSDEGVKGAKSDTEALWEAVADGTVDAIASDHAPHTTVEKSRPFDQTPNGIVGLETTLPLFLTHVLNTETVDLKRMVELLSINPCRLLHGEVPCVGGDVPANLTIIDTETPWLIDAEKFKSKGRNTPFHGHKVTGGAVYTVVNGKFHYAQVHDAWQRRTQTVKKA